MLTQSEKKMWEKPVKASSPDVADADINNKYRVGEQRLVTETVREKLPNFIDALEKPGYMEIRPFYQRRERWKIEQQSRLIESFIMNIPVPPLFLYEKDYNQYEVMDGQQRINALKSFYDGEFKLKGLNIWEELNGRTYSTLPSQIRQGLDRRSVSYIIVLKESTSDEEGPMLLRQAVFERLNTGGIKLERQEIRNCLFHGPDGFNKMLLDITKLEQFRDAFDMPKYTENEENEPGSRIRKNNRYKKMEDAELVLRFFALRHIEHFTKGMGEFLDIYMSRARNFSEEDIEQLRHLYVETLDLATRIYTKDIIFRLYDFKKDKWNKNRGKPFYEAVMVGLSNHLSNADILVSRREEVINETKRLLKESPPGMYAGRQGSTKGRIQERIDKFSEMIKNILNR